MSIFLVGLYSVEHEYNFWVQIIICIQSNFAAACFFVYFEYIQIFIFNLHSMAAHALTNYALSNDIK